MSDERCPCCGDRGENVTALRGSDLLACMNMDCRVNEFETYD